MEELGKATINPNQDSRSGYRA